jgi:hypothetical protein
VRNLVRSEGYARARLVTGSIAAVLGAILIARTLASTGLSFKVIPACVLGAAMIALGIVRFRDYAAARRGPL